MGYWSPTTFPFIAKYEKLSPEEREEVTSLFAKQGMATAVSRMNELAAKKEPAVVNFEKGT
jgi:hypothetical protein